MRRARLCLRPGQPGTKSLLARYGKSLVCVRYRYDERTKQRIKTIELIVDRTKWRPEAGPAGGDTVVALRVGWEAAAEREVFLRGMPVLEVGSDVLSLGQELMTGIPLPEKAAVDAVHIAVAALNGLDYLVTWNCKHIANPALRDKIEETCRTAGYIEPVICTPPELIEVPDE